MYEAEKIKRFEQTEPEEPIVKSTNKRTGRKDLNSTEIKDEPMEDDKEENESDSKRFTNNNHFVKTFIYVSLFRRTN